MKKKRIPEWYVPSVKDAEWFINNWREERKFFVPVEAMIKICQETFPKNDNLEEVLLKCATINTFSSTNVFDLLSVANHIVDLQIDERLAYKDLSLVNDIAKIEIGGKEHNFYSFASKYCHYHNPETYAIYDRYVDKVLCLFLKEFCNIRGEQLREYDEFILVIKEFRQHYNLDNLSLEDLDKYLWQLGRWYFNPYLTYKYYNREDENPFPSKDIRNKFWHGEMMFVTTHQKVGEWKEKGKEFLKDANEKIQVLASILTPEQFGVVTYIYKSFPCDNREWIVNY